MFVNQTRGSVDIISCEFFLGGDVLRILNHRKKTNSKGTHKRWAKKPNSKKNVQIICGQAQSDSPCSTFCRRGSGGHIGV